MSGKLDYINMIKKVSPYNLKKGDTFICAIMDRKDSG